MYFNFVNKFIYFLILTQGIFNYSALAFANAIKFHCGQMANEKLSNS